ncbi:MAG: single-stranded DNA-binding protein [Nitrospirae bacterium]|nr:single-stranded DNA-binding protein [Nitrospirota bacterium]
MFNKVILIGNLTRDPEVRYTPQGTSVCNFGIAVNRKYKQGDDLKEEVTFINIVVFGKQAESCGQYLNKGSSVLVEGRLQERRWETEEGQQRSKHEVVAQQVRFLSSKKHEVSDHGFSSDERTLPPDETTDLEPF